MIESLNLVDEELAHKIPSLVDHIYYILAVLEKYQQIQKALPIYHVWKKLFFMLPGTYPTTAKFPKLLSAILEDAEEYLEIIQEWRRRVEKD